MGCSFKVEGCGLRIDDESFGLWVVGLRIDNVGCG